MRERIVAFACWMFGHELLVPRVDTDTVSCECGKRVVTNSVRAVAQVGRVWRLRA